MLVLILTGKCSPHQSFSLQQMRAITESHNLSNHKEQLIMGYPDTMNAFTTPLLCLSLTEEDDKRF